MIVSKQKTGQGRDRKRKSRERERCTREMRYLGDLNKGEAPLPPQLQPVQMLSNLKPRRHYIISHSLCEKIMRIIQSIFHSVTKTSCEVILTAVNCPAFGRGSSWDGGLGLLANKATRNVIRDCDRVNARDSSSIGIHISCLPRRSVYSHLPSPCVPGT